MDESTTLGQRPSYISLKPAHTNRLNVARLGYRHSRPLLVRRGQSSVDEKVKFLLEGLMKQTVRHVRNFLRHFKNGRLDTTTVLNPSDQKALKDDMKSLCESLQAHGNNFEKLLPSLIKSINEPSKNKADETTLRNMRETYEATMEILSGSSMKHLSEDLFDLHQVYYSYVFRRLLPKKDQYTQSSSKITQKASHIHQYLQEVIFPVSVEGGSSPKSAHRSSSIEDSPFDIYKDSLNRLFQMSSPLKLLEDPSIPSSARVSLGSVYISSLAASAHPIDTKVFSAFGKAFSELAKSIKTDIDTILHPEHKSS